MVMARRPVPPQPPKPVPAAPGSPGPVGGHGSTGSCAGMSPEPALAKAGGGCRLDRAADGASRPASAQRVGVVDAVAASQRRRHQRHHLVARVGSARRSSEVNVVVDEFTHIPDAQEHFLTPSARPYTHLFSGLGLMNMNVVIDSCGNDFGLTGVPQRTRRPRWRRSQCCRRHGLTGMSR